MQPRKQSQEQQEGQNEQNEALNHCLRTRGIGLGDARTRLDRGRGPWSESATREKQVLMQKASRSCSRVVPKKKQRVFPEGFNRTEPDEATEACKDGTTGPSEHSSID